MVKELLLLPLFRQFIKDTQNGKRRQPNGELIKPQTIANYGYVLHNLIEYEKHGNPPLRIKTNIRNNQRLLLQEKDYWKRFHVRFTEFLLYKKSFYDNYTGCNLKIIKSLLIYLRDEKQLVIQDHYRHFYIRKESVKIIALQPDQLRFLLHDVAFHQSLPLHLRRTKDLFVFGCLAALRFSDLMSLRVSDVQESGGRHYLHFYAVKTVTPLQIKLPPFAVALAAKYARRKKGKQYLFPQVALAPFNKSLQQLALRAGWTQPLPKTRTRNGVPVEQLASGKRSLRFCDQLSSHAMRRTGITVLLTNGMPEHLVRKVSGHSDSSRSFFRYVDYSQHYVSSETDKAYALLEAATIPASNDF